jgi:hypothetical protein
MRTTLPEARAGRTRGGQKSHRYLRGSRRLLRHGGGPTSPLAPPPNAAISPRCRRHREPAKLAGHSTIRTDCLQDVDRCIFRRGRNPGDGVSRVARNEHSSTRDASLALLARDRLDLPRPLGPLVDELLHQWNHRDVVADEHVARLPVADRRLEGSGVVARLGCRGGEALREAAAPVWCCGCGSLPCCASAQVSPAYRSWR